MKNILDQLYWGELDQCNRERKQDETLEKAMQSIYEISDCLLGRARGEEMRLLEELLRHCMDAIALSSLYSFKDGFRLCEKLFLEGITNPKEQ